MKRWFEPVTTAWLGVVTHKLRSFLTILGIVIGVAAVITLMSIGRGAQQQILSNISSLGSNLITIRPGATNFGGVRGAVGSGSTLTLEDAAAISEQIQYVDTVAPTYSTSFQVVVGAQNTRTQVTGVTTGYQDTNNLKVADGAFISDYDYQRGAKVAVIGSNVKDTLFADTDPLGQQIRMGNYVVRVIGILESKGLSLVGSADDAILIPLTALQQMSAQTRTSRGDHVVSSISVAISDDKQATYVSDEITTLLRSRHQLGPGVDNDFNILSLQEIASTISQTIGTMTLLLGAIAAISLLVGGIGVMNIMLVSVLERTREIGIRKALGARERDIWGQFLIEAALLTFAGGIIGVGLGWLIAAFVNRTGALSTVVSPDIVILAVSVSVGIGLFFGFYPAWNASRLNPIDALRSE
ncbi:MAG: ABC transporter permease [Chloroflexi bacterium]|nr:ABC transporter permease [Chloroflexota bacterium]